VRLNDSIKQKNALKVNITINIFQVPKYNYHPERLDGNA
jgi:hypothetical protein